MGKKEQLRRRIMVGASFLIFLLMWATMTTSKVTLVWLMWLHKFEMISSATWYAIVLIVLLTPHICTLINVVWSTSFICVSRWTKWPTIPNLILGIGSSVIETVAMTVFILEIAPLLPADIFLLVTNAVFAFPLICHFGKKYKMRWKGKYDPEDFLKGEATPSYSLRKFVFQTVISSTGIWAPLGIATVLYIWSPYKMELFDAIMLPFCLVFLSMLWVPAVQADTMKAADGIVQNRWKSSGLYTCIKVLLTPFVVGGLVMLRFEDLKGDYFLTFMKRGLTELNETFVWVPLFMLLFSGLMSMFLAMAAAKLTLTNTGLLLPSIISTPTTIIICYFMCDVFTLVHVQGCYSNDVSSWCATAMAAILWIIPYAIGGTAFTRPSKVLLKPFDNLFLQFTWNNVCLDQSIMLNYSSDGFKYDSFDEMVTDTSGKSKIFMCTTMFREAEFEMRRLLRSVGRVSLSDKLKDVYMEAHIFLDNGSKDQQLTDFAYQLIHLLFEELKVDPKTGLANETPYGVQMSFVLPGGLALFIHMKDACKFKNKKRWSQVMYMNYILDYRCKKANMYRIRTPNDTNGENVNINVGLSTSEEWKQNNLIVSGKEKKNIRPITKRLHRNPAINLELEHLTKLLTERQLVDDKDVNTGSVQLSIVRLLHLLHARSEALRNDGSSSSSGAFSDHKSFSGESSSEDSTEISDSYTISFDSSGHHSAPDADDTDISSHSSDMNEHSETDDDVRCKHRQNSLLQKQRIGKHASHYPFVLNSFNSVRGKMFREAVPSLSRMKLIPDLRSEKYAVDNGGLALDKENAGTFDNIYSISDGKNFEHKDPKEDQVYFDDNTYILATDADMDFDDTGILQLLNMCNRDKRIGGSCGRTHPVGHKNSPIVWYQKFEYAKDFWMIKTAQNVIGCVMCCPGCFSLYRAAAVRDVRSKYGEPTDKAFEVFIKDNGEDRWMCTLMMLNGWKLEYTAYSRNTTYCPDTFLEFLKQRRRWVLSEMSNLMLIFRNLRHLAQQNAAFSLIYMAYILQMFLLVLLSPATTIIVLTASLDILFEIPCVWTTPIFLLCLILYTILCATKPVRTQATITLIITIVLGIVMLAISVGYVRYIIQETIDDLADGHLEFKEYYLLFVLILSVLYAAIMHPTDSWNLACGFIFLLIFPAMYILLPFYAVANIVDTAWGTRDQSDQADECCGISSITSCKKPRDKLKEAEEKQKNVEDILHYSATSLPSLKDGNLDQKEEHAFWQTLRDTVLGKDVNLGTDKESMAIQLKTLRNTCVTILMTFNILWLGFLTAMYLVVPKGNSIFAFTSCAIYSFSVVIQLIGMTKHKIDSIFNWFVYNTFGAKCSTWVHNRRPLER